MKKVIALVLSIMVIFGGGVSTNAEDPDVVGLEEHLNALFIINNFSQERLEDMMRQWEEHYTEDFYSTPWELLKKAQWRIIKGKTAEEELEYRLEEYRINFDKGLLVTCLNSEKYLEQYAKTNNFQYLFSDQRYWGVADDSDVPLITKFTENGDYFWDLQKVLNTATKYSIVANSDMWEFLMDTNRIKQIILEKNETVVTDMKIFTLGNGFAFLYLKCNTNEYLVKLRTSVSGGEKIPQIKLFKAYPIEEVIGVLTIPSTGDYSENDTRLGAGGAKMTAAVKPTFVAEGEALMADGLMQGNEKGLDPLKPLSRIEATTILVRALGYENELTDTESKFVDISNDNWGAKYANIAADKGITKGVGDGRFAPNDLVTDNQFATLLLRTVNTPEFDWQTGIQILIEQGIITAENAKTMDFFTRGDMAKIIYEAKQKGLI